MFIALRLCDNNIAIVLRLKKTNYCKNNEVGVAAKNTKALILYDGHKLRVVVKS